MIIKKELPKDIFYLDNASTTIPYGCDIPDNIWYNASAPYNGGVEVREIFDRCKKDILEIFNVSKGDVLFTSGATEANNIVVQSVINALLKDEWTDEYNIVVSPTEHPSVLNIYKKINSQGILDVRYLPVDKNGNVIIEKLDDIIDDNTVLVSCMYINNEVGNIQPIKELGKICDDNFVLFHVDATQAIGKIEIDCLKNYIDFLTFSAHKFHGPKGIGAIVCRDIDRYDFLSSLIYGGHQQDSKRPGTENVKDIYIMTELLKYFCSKEEISKSQEISIFINKLIKSLLERYFNINDFKINSINDMIPICNISFKNITGEYLVERLSDEGIYVSSGSACNTGLFENSHVLEAMNVSDDYIEGTIRISFDVEDDNLTMQNIENVIKKIKEIISN